MSKRGQVTIFIIIGILVLFIFAGVLLVSRATVKERMTEEGEPIIEEVPLEFGPIKAFTENCLYSVGKKGLLILGQQGGYIYPEVLGEFSVSEPTDSMGINLEPTKVPYWHYNAESNEGNEIFLASWQPKLYHEDDPEFSIEAQLGRFVDEKLDSCLEDYAAFENQGFEVDKGEIETEVNVGEGIVGFTLRMPLEMERGEATAEMNTFYIRIPLELKHYYEVADMITGAERDFSFLERQGLNLISIFSGTDMEKLPPTSATTLEMVPTIFWNELDVEEKVKRTLSSYIPMLRFLGSDNFYDYVYPDSELSNLYQSTYDQMVVNLGGAEDLEVNFNYFNWPIYLKTNSVNGIIKPFHFFVQYEMLMMGQQTYETNYDISYPVLVTLRDSAAFDGEGYDFVFSLEGNIRNNEPAKDGEVREAIPRAASRLACKEDLWDTGILKTVVVDSFTKEPVEMVKVGFTIPEQEECEIGFTDSEGAMESEYPAVYGGVMNFFKEDYLINFYPIDTYGYKDKSGIIGYAVEGLGAGMPEKVIEMHKFKKIDITVKKKNLEKCLTPLHCTHATIALPVPIKQIFCKKDKRKCFFNKDGLFLDEPIASFEANGSLSRYTNYYFTGSTKKLSDSESAMVILRRVSDLNPEIMSHEFSVTVNLEGEDIEEVELVPGIYEISGSIYLNEEISIAKEERCVSYNIITWEEEECFTLNETKMDNFMGGMIEWNTPKTYFKVTPEDLYTSDSLEIYLLNQNLKDVPEKTKVGRLDCAGVIGVGVAPVLGACVPKDVEINGRVVEDLQLMGEMADISRMPEVRNALEPKFS